MNNSNATETNEITFKKQAELINKLDLINHTAYEEYINNLDEKPDIIEVNYIPIEDFPTTERMQMTIFSCNPKDYDNVRKIFQEIYPYRWLANRSYISGE